MVKKTILVVGFVVLVIAIFVFVSFNYFSEKESFSVKPYSLQLGMLLDSKASAVVKITNNENTEQEFDISFTNFANLAFIDEKKFSLASGDSKEVKIFFNSSGSGVDIYPGQLIVRTSLLEKKIPILLNVRDKNRVFTINQDGIPEYSNVYPGGKLGVKISVFDIEGKNTREVRAKYLIKNFKNELILSQEKALTIDGTYNTDYVFDIPNDWVKGDYVFVVSIDYKGIKNTAGYFFTISDKQETFTDNTTFFILFILIFIVGVVILAFYFTKSRDDLLVQLKKQQNRELKRNLAFVRSSKMKLDKIKDSPEKTQKVRELRKIKNKIIGDIKKKQKIQVKELKKLKKHGKKNEINSKLKNWEKQGYQMVEAENNMKNFSQDFVKKHIDTWKKKGFDTSYLR